MKPNEYVKLASTTRSGTNQNLDSDFMDNIHMMLGVMSESGEIADVFKKNLSYKVPIDWTNVKEELGDLMWYIAGFCDINGFSLEEVMETNINKLKARYPEGFKEHDATHRDLDVERGILEKEGIKTDEHGWPLEPCGFVEVLPSYTIQENVIIGEEEISDDLVFFSFTKETVDLFVEVINDTLKMRACPSCKRMDGHTKFCNLEKVTEILIQAIGDYDA